jgi:hypothetical protein
MGTVTGPGVSWWDSFDTILDPSSNLLYPGTGFTFSNPLKYAGWSDWTMTDNTNLIAGSGISKYVKQTSKQQFSQRVVQVGNKSSTMFSTMFIYRHPQIADWSTIIQWQSNNLVFVVEANGVMTLKHNNVNFIASGFAITDNNWRHFAFTRSGTAATMYINGIGVTTFTGLAAVNNSATDTKMFDFQGCDGALGQMWFSMGQTITAAQVREHYRAFRGRFGIR